MENRIHGKEVSFCSDSCFQHKSKMTKKTMNSWLPGNDVSLSVDSKCENRMCFGFKMCCLVPGFLNWFAAVYFPTLLLLTLNGIWKASQLRKAHECWKWSSRTLGLQSNCLRWAECQFPTCYGTWRFITVFTRTCHWLLSCQHPPTLFL
jgi:hypothetical protein